MRWEMFIEIVARGNEENMGVDVEYGAFPSWRVQVVQAIAYFCQQWDV